MTQRKAGYSKLTSVSNQNTAESFNDQSSGLDQSSLLEQLFGKNYKEEFSEKKQKQPQRKEFSIFNYNNYYEKEIVKKQIKELTEQIKKEVEYLKKADNALMAEVVDIEKITMESLPQKPGIYHVRFLEIVLRMLQTLREKVSESKTWLSAMINKKKKRGSLFASLSKKKGTQYSMSQELSSARSIQ